jgi:multiple sugar transport system ATP-binding protein
MATVSIDKVDKRYEGATEPAVKGMSLSVAEGEFMVLLGPSGCGKSSVLRMIAGLESITAGTVSIGNRVVNQVPAKDRDIAMVFQSYALYPHMNVYTNLAFGLRRRGVPSSEIDRRVQVAASKLGLTTLLNRKPHALSGGQRQRVAVGRAIVRAPKVFLFDEPLSNLDAALRVTTRNELIKQQHELATTTIYVTHDQVEAMTMGDRVCIMNRGEVVQVGRPLDVYRNPADTFVARFLGSPQMNLLPGSLGVEGERVILHLACLSFDLPRRLAAPLSRYVGRDVIIGMRPEDLYHGPTRGELHATAQLPVRVIAVEPLGSETILMVSLGDTGQELIARIGRDTTLKSGDLATITFDVTTIHYFDPVTTKAIVWGM